MIPDLLAALHGLPDTTLHRINPPRSRASVCELLSAAGYPVHEDVVSVYTRLDGAALERPDLELWIWSLEELLAENAWEHLLENAGFDPDDEVGEVLSPYRIFAKHERSLWLVNLESLETAVAFDEDVTPLSVDFAGMIAALIAGQFTPGWYEAHQR